MVQARIDTQEEFAPSDSYIKEPEKAFRADICLNGNWAFQPVALPANFKNGIDPVPDLGTPAPDKWEQVPLRVPSSWNANAFADEKGLGGDFRTYPSYPDSWNDVKMGWLRRTVSIPQNWQGRRVLLHFAAAAGDVSVRVNGKEAGKQFDVFFPFDIDVTDEIEFGATNEILVGVQKPSLTDIQGKYGRRNYQGGSFWGQHVVGLWQDVDLVAVPEVRISDVFVQPLLDQDDLKIEVAVHNDGDAPAQVDLSGAVHAWVSLADKEGGNVAAPKWKLDDATALSLSAPPIASIPAHADQTVVLEQKVGDSLKTWSPDAPNLYGLVLDLKNNGQPIDRKYTRFGWRQLTFQGAKQLLNGQPIILKGDSWHFLGIPQMTRRYPWAWFTALHAANANAVRLHAEPYPEFYLDVADEMGVMVLDETAIWASDGGPKLDSDTFWNNTNEHVESLVRRDRNHPAVFGWSVCNEVKPIVQGVFQNPPGMYDKLLTYYSTWIATCRRVDPTRPWISADGDEDGSGRFPAYVVHYGGIEKAVASGKPWGMGETGGAYYMTPEQSAKTNGERSYESFLGRMEGIATTAYGLLMDQRKNNANYRSVFNLVWYGLQPLPLGMADTSHSPTLDDGVYFPPLVDGKPGVQPERLGPYCTTLNPGYDPSLPLYKTWPLFDAIKAANAEPPDDFPAYSLYPAPVDFPKPATVNATAVLGGADSKLQDELAALGIPFDSLASSGAVPDVLFIDGAAPPDGSARQEMEKVYANGGTVVVWGPTPAGLAALNALLPSPLELTGRQSSSLLPKNSDPVIAGLKPSDLYFSELTPSIILDGGLGGPLVKGGSVLLEACNTEWTLWNKRPEYAKTGMIFRSEMEAKPSGAALVKVKEGSGRLLLCNLPAEPRTFKGSSLDRTVLQNLGFALKAPVDVGEPFLKTGKLVRAVAVGRFPATGDGASKAYVDPAKSGGFNVGGRVEDKRWGEAVAPDGLFDLRKDPLVGPGDNAVSYLTVWIMSPRPLDNLLLEPNIPKLDLALHTGDALEVFLNGKSIFTSPEGAPDAQITVPGLGLQLGWNNLLIRLVHSKGEDKFGAELVCSQPEFLDELKSAEKKP